MTDLDRKIAELKGWRPEKPFDLIKNTDEVFWLNEQGSRTPYAVNGFYNCTGVGGYDHGEYVYEYEPSQNIAQAFELVNEVCGPRADRLIPISFILSCAEPGKWVKQVKFFQWEKNQIVNEWNGEGSSIQEAICRAYIALKEWEAK